MAWKIPVLLGFKARQNPPHPPACLQQSPQEIELICLVSAILAQKENILARHTITTHGTTKQCHV